MDDKWITKVVFISIIQSMLVVSAVILNLHIIEFNRYMGGQICLITGIPEDLALTTSSMGFLNNVIVIMLLLEQTILSRTYYKIIEKGINYLSRFAY